MHVMASSYGFDGGGTGVLAPTREKGIKRRLALAGGPPRDPDRPGDGGGGGGDGEGDGAEDGAAGVGRLALGLALAGISTLFLVLLAVWLFLRRGASDWPPPGPFSPPRALWISTLLLAASSAAVEAAARGARGPTQLRGATLRWLWSGFFLGLLFVAAQVFVWRALWVSGLVPSSSGYAAVFYALTSLHGLHVLGGLLFQGVLCVDLRRARARRTRRHSVRLCASYWHFMGAIWLVLFTLLYFVR